MSSSTRQPQTWAVCIGINFYPNTLRTYADSLKGCVGDAQSWVSYLTNTAGVPADNITLLTSTPDPDASRYRAVESETRRLANYANITKELLNVAEKAQPGDQVIITYSGHGGREYTIVPGWATKSFGCDETLVPMDALIPGSYHIRDFEMNYMLSKIAERPGVRLMVILDSCHSGGAFRDADELDEEVPVSQPRTLFKQLNEPDERTEEEEEELGRQTRGYAEERPLGADPISGVKGVTLAQMKVYWDRMVERTQDVPAQQWLVKPLGYDIWTGCLAHELSWEIFGAGRLTAALIDSLETAAVGNRMTGSLALKTLYRNVYDRVYEKHYKKKTREWLLQTPVLLGDIEKQFIVTPLAVGSMSAIPSATTSESQRTKKSVVSIPIHAVPFHPTIDKARPEGTHPQLILRAGTAHGINLGSEYAVYLWTDDLDTSPPTENMVRVVVTEVSAIASVVKVIGSPTDLARFKAVSEAQHNRQGKRMEDFYTMYPFIKRKEQEITMPWPSGCQAVLISGPASQVKIVRLAGVGTAHPAPWNEGKEMYIRAEVPLLVIPEGSSAGPSAVKFTLAAASSGTGYEVYEGSGTTEGNLLTRAKDINRALKRIVHISQYRAVKELQSPASGRNVAPYLTLRKLKSETIQDSTGKNMEKISLRFQCAPEYIEKEDMKYVNVAIFHFGSDYSIRQIYPVEGNFESVDVGDKREFYIQRELPAGTPSSVDGVITELVRVVVYQSSTSFRMWEMNGLTENSDEVMRGEIHPMVRPGKLEDTDPKPAVPASRWGQRRDGDLEMLGWNKYWLVDTKL